MQFIAGNGTLPLMTMNSSLRNIPITVVSKSADMKLHWQRRAVQWGFVLLAILIPVSGLLRIDPVAGAFVILDRQIWWSDFFLIFGCWLVLASLLVVIYSSVGTAFCGWACPQNSLAEWANHMTRRLLGKRAELQLNGEVMQVAGRKNRLLNWLLLGIALLVPAMLFALIPLFYFYEPGVILSFVLFRDDARLAPSLHYIYLIFTLVFFVDTAFIRHFWCRFMCVYKIWQHGFKTRQTLHITYDKARAQECAKCNLCVTSCFIDIDPRATDIYDTCINCGECVTACDNLQARKGQTGLLRFKIGDDAPTGPRRWHSRLGSLSERLRWTLAFTAVGTGMLVWGLWAYEPYHLTAYRADLEIADHIQDYRIAVSHKLYRKARLHIEVQGLPEGSYVLAMDEAVFDSAGRVDINLHINPVLPAGLHGILIKASADDGWSDSFRVQHFVAKG